MGMSKSVKVTFRLGEKDDKALMEAVERTGITKSDYIRQVVLRDIYKRNVDSSIMEKICRLSTLCTLILEKYEISEEQRRLLMKEGRELWKEL